MDIEKAKELRNSLMWAEVIEEIDKKIYMVTQRLVLCKSEELLDLQREIKVYQSVKQLPDDIISREE